MKLKMILFNLTIAVLFFSCDGKNTRDAGESADNDEFSGNMENRDNNNKWDQERRNDFVKKAALINMTEIRAGEIAQNKGQSQEIKNYGQTLVNDHKKANQELKNIAQNQNIPQNLDEDHREKIQELQEASNNEFDRKFLDMMVEGHEDAIDKFEDAQKNLSGQQQLKSWVDNTLPVLRRHLEKAKQLKDQQSS